MSISIQALKSVHDTDAFECGVEVLDSWLKHVARQHIRKGISRTFVAVDERDPTIVLGFHSLTAAEAECDTLPERLAKKLPRRVPVVLLGRLATASSARGKGVGKLLLADALTRIVRTAEQVGIAAILVDAKDEDAVRFYERFGFLPLPDMPNRLVMPLATAKAAVT